MMKKLLLPVLLVGIVSAAATEKKPVLLLGQSYDSNPVKKNILLPAGINSRVEQKWVKPADYGRYAAVYYGLANKSQKEARWESPEDIANLKKYVSEGGILIVTGGALYNLTGKGRSLAKLQDILGFGYSYNLNVKEYQSVVFTPEGAELMKQAGLKKDRWNWVNSCLPGNITTAKVLAQYVGEGVKPMPAILVNTVGKGKVYTVTMSYFGLVRGIKSMGDADDQGRFILNADGERAQALARLYQAIFLSAPDLDRQPVGEKRGEWGVKPLGAPGKLVYRTDRGKAPEFRPRKNPKAVFPLAENGQSKAVIVPNRMAALARELKLHLDRMTGADFQITNSVPADGAAIVFQPDASLPPETVIARTEKNRVILSGHPAAGVRLAMNYFLEKLGCRYLWPGAEGKVIPERETLYAPEMELNTVPVLVVRGIRNANPAPRGRVLWGFKACGMTDPADVKLYCKTFAEKNVDAKGNQTMWQWHGMGARGGFSWGHAFGHFWTRYGAKHPEYFALQPEGSRDQSLSPDRPRLCLGNPAAADAAARDILAFFAANPKAGSRSICLNDGGATSFCMCKVCRQLDPVNAHPQKMSFSIAGQRKVFDYVSLTNRVLTFSNRIAEKVAAKYPDKLLSVYIYSVYSSLPVSVRPHPALIFCLTNQSYVNEAGRQKCLDDFRKWTSFGNRVFFRPNALWGHFQIIAPQNYARKMFNDLEYYKANGLAGTDFDCLERQWSGKGLIYYTLLKAHWNPDRLSFDDLFDDYCRSGFGTAAAEVKAYWTKLEQLTDRAAETGRPYLEFFTAKTAAELGKLLDRAEEKVRNDPACLARVKFLRLGLTAGEFTIAMQEALDRRDQAGYRAKLAEFRQWIRKTSLGSPFALDPGILYRNRHLR